MGRPEDVLRGFESGADDYLPKPFELSVFMARLNALLRRREWFRRDHAETGRASSGLVTDEVGGGAAEEVFEVDGKTIDLGALELRTPTQTVRLTLMEVQLLRYLIKHEGKVVSRKAMLEDVWGVHEDTDTRAIDNFIVRLRKYLEDEPTRPRHLLTVRGVGYRFVAGPSKENPSTLNFGLTTTKLFSFYFLDFRGGCCGWRFYLDKARRAPAWLTP